MLYVHLTAPATFRTEELSIVVWFWKGMQRAACTTVVVDLFYYTVVVGLFYWKETILGLPLARKWGINIDMTKS